MNAASAGDTVLVTNGVYVSGAAVTLGYSLNNRVCVTHDLLIQSVNGGTLASSTVSHNESLNEAGGVRCEGGGTVLGCTIKQNSCRSGGGGIFLVNGSPLVERCEITGNDCYELGATGGGIWL